MTSGFRLGASGRSRPIADGAAIGKPLPVRSIRRQIDLVELAAHVEDARLHPELAALKAWWITFCIIGNEAALVRVAEGLAARGAENLGDADTGTLNAKLLVPSETAMVIALIADVVSAVEVSGAELVAIDADSTMQVERSTLAQLWTA